MIINRFYKRHPPSDNKTGDFIKYPVLIVQAPPLPDEGRLYNEILETLNAPYKQKDAPAKKEFQVFRLLEQIGTKMLIIDEIHDILAGTPLKQQQFLNVVKRLGNRLKIPIVGVGTDQASNVLQSDAQLANRFDSEVLPRWNIDNDFSDLLANFERTLPLKNPSNLHEEDLAIELHSMSEGLIGELDAVLTKACVEAIKRKTEKITSKVLKSIRWTQPSDRKRGLRAGA
jgi:DNA transposition AAA+ family ATPase